MRFKFPVLCNLAKFVQVLFMTSLQAEVSKHIAKLKPRNAYLSVKLLIRIKNQ